MSETPGLSFACLGGLGNGGWRGALRIAQRQAPLRGEGFGELGRRLPAEAGVGAFGVVVRAPGRERGAGVVQGRKQRFVQKLVAQSTVEALDEGVLGRLARRDVVPVDLAVVCEGQDGVRGELGSVACWELRTVEGYGRLRSHQNSAAGGHNRGSGLYGGFANHTTEETGYGQG